MAFLPAIAAVASVAGSVGQLASSARQKGDKPPGRDDAAVEEERRRLLQARAKQRGRQSTILAGGLEAEQPQVQRANLLGG